MTKATQISSATPIPSQPVRKYNSGNTEIPSFSQTLTQRTNAHALKFSNHAQKRLQARDIELTQDGLTRLVSAVEKVEKRGGRDSLVLMDELAFIVNVKDHLVVTAMSANERGEGVFTQIDSVVLAD
jgi:flagellar operon protein